MGAQHTSCPCQLKVPSWCLLPLHTRVPTTPASSPDPSEFLNAVPSQYILKVNPGTRHERSVVPEVVQQHCGYQKLTLRGEDAMPPPDTEVPVVQLLSSDHT